MLTKTIAQGCAALALMGLLAPAASAQTAPSPVLAQFAPKAQGSTTRLDYTAWDEALQWVVLQMGRSLREAAPRPEASTGSRQVYGHDSRYRLEGSRIAFQFMDDDIRTFLSEYRRDLETLPGRVDFTALPRNEQLAYWINLHNVAVMEQIALAYPVSSPEDVKLGEAKVPLDEARFITVGGTSLSPRDIRTRIVYPNWDDPKVIYGFWRGAIGGPTLDRDAYTSANLPTLLEESAREFIGSLRGTQKRGNTLQVSRIYDEARPFFFADWPEDLRAHLRELGTADVAKLLDATSEVEWGIWDRDVADLSKGEREPDYNQVVANGEYGSIRIPGAVARLMQERRDKLEKIRRDGGAQGQVIVMPDWEAALEPVEEVE